MQDGNAAFAADTDYADVVPRGDTWAGVDKPLVIIVMRQFAKGQEQEGIWEIEGGPGGLRGAYWFLRNSAGKNSRPFSTRPLLSTGLSTQLVDKQQLMKPIMAGVEAVLLWDESHPHGLSA